MDEADMVKLLGRPLTSTESANFDEYLEIAEELLEDALCYSPFADDSSDAELRYFESREGYSTVFVGAFEDVTSVLVDGEAVTNYTPYLWDSRNSNWYNSLVFDTKFTDDVEIQVTAAWGFTELPLDLQRLLSKYFVLVSSGSKSDSNMTRKTVEDFSIWRDNSKTDDERLTEANAKTISKYSICGIGNLKHGKTCHTHGRYNCGNCI